MANWGKGIAMMLASAGNSLSNYADKKREYNEKTELAKLLADAKKKEPIDYMSGPLRDLVLSGTEDGKSMLSGAGIDLNNLTPGQLRYLKLRAPGGGGGGGGFNFGTMGNSNGGVESY